MCGGCTYSKRAESNLDSFCAEVDDAVLLANPGLVGVAGSDSAEANSLGLRCD